jgi:protein-L-isoaspartate(D-aspartate) O-methyltransferase
MHTEQRELNMTYAMRPKLASNLNLNGIGMTSQRTRERLLGRLMDQGIKSMKVLDVIRSTPRHIFLDDALSHRAYEDVALPIGHNQTISQPFIVARMTEAIVDSGSVDNVLEIGTGCGYQTAVIAQLAKSVCTVERIKPLLTKAQKNLKLLGLQNIKYKHDDGSLGWDGKGVFDAIITTAAPQEIPSELLSQLNVGGRLIIPVGGKSVQELRLITRTRDEFTTKVLNSVRFVPLLVGQVQN